MLDKETIDALTNNLEDLNTDKIICKLYKNIYEILLNENKLKDIKISMYEKEITRLSIRCHELEISD
jgi:hypothetical protein